MRLDLVVLPRRRPVWLAPFDRARDGGESTFDEGADLAGERQQPRGDALQDGQRVGREPLVEAALRQLVPSLAAIWSPRGKPSLTTLSCQT